MPRSRNSGNARNSKLHISNFFCELIKFQTTIKLFHFQTSHFGGHKASDKLYKDFHKKYDKLLEVYQGKYGRIPSINASIKITSVTDSKIEIYCRRFVKYLQRSTEGTCKVKCNSDICNIIDEIIADINQFIYLVSFK